MDDLLKEMLLNPECHKKKEHYVLNQGLNFTVTHVNLLNGGTLHFIPRLFVQ